jgi:hypothetical protein
MRILNSISVALPVALLGLASLLTASASVAASLTVEELDACLQENLPKKSTVLDVEFRSRDRANVVTSLRAKLYWKDFDGKARVLLRLSDPPKYRGSALLIIQKQDEQRDMFMFLPELGRSKRITGRMMSGPVFGTDFSYEEF